ncbi:hypothetical protein [Xanthobacter tagetidis]|uniref:Uncharacterized protein n=1 Tax=Xanthobacter tagetidis TaxID=60216 RepID=A0A3L7AHW7_9HYPH|nr:hypothetical protein [Xanthobacter tagetidis]MBB6306281.1 hypothetical protein [Xanthobacter tagetidis]RLP79555.1 hypothetical protein D9R14_07785 [Xanthobacter tagetidis]
MGNVIMDTGNIAEARYGTGEEPPELQSDMVATRDPEGKGIEFHVSMRSWTQRDMEELIVEAAARVVVGEYGNNKLAKLVEERCIAIVTAQADKHLYTVAADVLDRPILPKYPYQKPDAQPVTMREFIGLTGRDYLEARVDNSGNPTTDRHYSKSRLQHIVESCVHRSFKTEIEKATNAAISEFQKAIKLQHDAFLDAEKKRLRDALAKATGATP